MMTTTDKGIKAHLAKPHARLRPSVCVDLDHGLFPGDDRWHHVLRPVNITNLFLQNSYIIIMALGMLLVIVAGHIDLSVGSVVGFVGALAAVMMVDQDLPVPITIALCLIMGA